MEIELLYFGRLREMTGKRQEKLDLREGDRISDLTSRLGEIYESDLDVMINNADHYIVLINGRHHGSLKGCQSLLKAGDQVAFMPVTDGG